MGLTVASFCSNVCHTATRREVDTITQPRDSLTYNLKSLYLAGWSQRVDSNFTSRISIPPTSNLDTSETQHFQSLTDVLDAGKWNSISHQTTCQVLAVPVMTLPWAQPSTQHQVCGMFPPALFQGHCFNHLLLSKQDFWYKLPTALLITQLQSNPIVSRVSITL